MPLCRVCVLLYVCEPECFPFGDLNGDYTTNASDLTIFDNIKKNGTYEKYNLLADVNLDGTIDATDRSYLVSNRNGWTGGVNVQSVDEVANDIGYAGYLFNDESQNYHVRNREYSPKLGRWLQRDPLEYPDGMNLYQYVVSSPARYHDPFGFTPPNHIIHPDGKDWTIPDGYRFIRLPDGTIIIEPVPDFGSNPGLGPANPYPGVGVIGICGTFIATGFILSTPPGWCVAAGGVLFSLLWGQDALRETDRWWREEAIGPANEKPEWQDPFRDIPDSMHPIRGINPNHHRLPKRPRFQNHDPSKAREKMREQWEQYLQQEERKRQGLKP